MSSQCSNGSSSAANISSGGSSNSQGITAAGNSLKSNSKMSIDHQATLDKGLKMKIKRTKPGTKSSEAKHEIVKATEQLQNGITICSSVAISNIEDTLNGVSSLSTPNSQNACNSVTNTNNANLNTLGKKNIGSTGNPLNITSASTVNTTNTTPNNNSQTASLGTKRGSSSHRREKAKEKSAHSNRADNKVISYIDKDNHDKPVCQCNEITTSPCSNAACIRSNEIPLEQRLSNSSSNINSKGIPPGIFVPSADGHLNSTSSTNVLNLSSSIENSQIITSTSGLANAPGPPNKDSNSMKISTHIAAQLAATTSNLTSISTLPKADNRTTSESLSKQICLAVSSAKVTPNTKICSHGSMQLGNNMLVSGADDSSVSPPPKRTKHNDSKFSEGIKLNKKEMIDICVGTSVGTITEPDCLGPCEPGTSVTLEGIVWHETEGGVLVVNVTWRGKTYVGTLLDCTRHDWAPPRFCDSPTDELDSRTPKGRGKRGRTVTTPDLSNFTETRSSIYFSHSNVHSKLRNGSSKGGRNSRVIASDKINSGSSLSSGNGGLTPSTSPTAFLPPRTEKRKSKDESPSPSNVDVENSFTANAIPNSTNISDVQTQNLISPLTGLNVSISSKKSNTMSICPVSPILFECPEQDCCKKYKHTNGLRYHQSHAHGNAPLLDEDVIAETEDNILTPLPSPATLAASSAEVGLFAIKNVPTEFIKDIESEMTVSGTNTNLTLDSQNTETKIESKLSKESQETLSSFSNYNESHSLLSDKTKTVDPVNKKQLVTDDSFENIMECTAKAVEQKDLNVPELQPEKEIESFLLKTNASVEIETELSTSFKGPKNNLFNSQQNTHNDDISNMSGKLSGTKLKKMRKSPMPDANVEEFNANTLTRDGVQSPAYSDISDDLNSVHEQILVDKCDSKPTETPKKNADMELATGNLCTSSGQSAVGSPVNSYGVYQFYQQQQFLVQPTIETPPSCKGSNAGITHQSTIETSQNVTLLSDLNKKQPTGELSMKNSSNISTQETNNDIQTISGTSQTASAVQNAQASTKSVSHFYAFNYMSPSYTFNVEQNYLSQLPIDDDKVDRNVRNLSPSDHHDQQSSTHYKEERGKEICSPSESPKLLNQTKLIKPEPLQKCENMKFDANNSTVTQVSQNIPLHSKDLQTMGVYSNIYQRHPLSAPQLTREEELRRYYIFSDQQRRQTSGLHSNSSQPQGSIQHLRDDSVQVNSQNLQLTKIKSNINTTTLVNQGKVVICTKEPPKSKEEDTKAVKQEGQKPTMETQGPPPPPTSQYFLHPSYITSAPFGFDPNHPMYRNVLMPPSSPYNTASYHLPLSRYHAPEDLSRNPGSKALDALHHAASQYYTTHKIHELSERALKSPNSTNGSSPNIIKVSVSSPNVASHPNQISHQSTLSTNNLPSQTLSNTKTETSCHKTHGNGSSIQTVNSNDIQKSPTNNSTTIVNSSGVNMVSSGGNGNSGGAPESRSPPPQRHVHTHHHTHVGLGYPMYPAPYGAAVLASQQAAAVAVINPFPPAPTK